MTANGQLTWKNGKRALGKLVPWEANPRQLTKQQAERLRQSIRKFGYSQPIEIDPNNLIIDGHQREAVMALMQEYGAVHQVDVRISSRPFSLEERKEYIAQKHRGAVGEWDFDAMLNLYDGPELLDWGFELPELEAMGFDFTADPPEDPGPEISKADELREKWQTESGQLWQLGAHRVICGDCTDAETVARVMGGEKAEMVFTDPPYNVAKESRNYAADKSKSMAVLKDAEWDQDFDVESLFPTLDSIMGKDCTVYVCTSHWLVHQIWEWMWTWSKYCSYNIWAKPNPMPALSKRHWTWATEIIAYAVRGRHTSNFPHIGHALNWWDIPKRKDTDHPTEKAVEVPERAVGFSSNPGDLVFDAFLGSGTTLIACERLGRRCRGVEIDPGYVAVTLERWHEMTGETPELVTK